MQIEVENGENEIIFTDFVDGRGCIKQNVLQIIKNL